MGWLSQALAVVLLGLFLSFQAVGEKGQNLQPTCADYFQLPFAEPSDLSEKFAQVEQWANAISPRENGRPFLSIVIPAYKEEARLPASIGRIKEFFDRFPLSVEVLAIIEKSPDNTLEAARAAAGDDRRIQIIDNEIQRGKGYAVRSGVLRGQGEMILFMDADLSTPLYEIINFLDQMRTNPEIDLLIGDRVQAIASQEESRSLFRKLLSRGFNSIIHTVSPLDFADTQAGFKVFRRLAAHKIFEEQRLDHFAFDVEVLMLASRMEFQTQAQSIHWVDDRRSTVRPIRDPLKMLWDVIKVQFVMHRRFEAKESVPL